MKRILVVDDDPSFSFQMEQLFKDKLNVQISADGISATSQISTGEFDTILLDIDILGDVDAIQILKEVRSNSRLKKIPVIVLTNLGDQRKQEFLNAGANEYFIKGEMNLDELRDMVVSYAESIPAIQPGEE